MTATYHIIACLVIVSLFRGSIAVTCYECGEFEECKQPISSAPTCEDRGCIKFDYSGRML